MNSENRRLGSVRHDEPQREDNQPDQENGKPSGGLKAEIISWIQILVTAACIAFVLNTFIIANSKVPSGSMENTIMTNDRVIGFRFSYWFSDPKEGDIAILYGSDERDEQSVEMAAAIPPVTISYELLVTITKRVPRIYL